MSARLLKDPSTAGSRIFVGHLQSEDTNKAELEEHFSKYGKVVGSLINRGFGFVQFDNDESAKNAIQKENGQIFKGRRIDVRPAKKENHGGGSGQQGGGMRGGASIGGGPGPGISGGPSGGPSMGPNMGGSGMAGGPPGMSGGSGMGPGPGICLGGPGIGGSNPFANNQFGPPNSFGGGNQNFGNSNFGGPNQNFNPENMQGGNQGPGGPPNRDDGNDCFDDDVQEIGNDNEKNFGSGDQFNNQNRGGNNQFGNQNRGNESFASGNGGGVGGGGGNNNGPANNQNNRNNQFSPNNQNRPGNNQNRSNQTGNQNQNQNPNSGSNNQRSRGRRGGKNRNKNNDSQGGGNNSFRDRSPIVRNARGNDDKGGRDWDRQRERNFGRESFNENTARFDDFKTSGGGFGPNSSSDNQPGSIDKNDCEIIVVNKVVTEYAEMIEMRLKKMGLTVDLLFPNEDVPLSRVLGNIASRGCLYAVVVNPINMEHHSLTLNILHGLPQEHRNMPTEDALALINRDFTSYKSNGRSVPLNTPFANDRHPDAIQVLVNMLADNHQLTVLQYDRILKYLEMKREEQIQIELGDAKDVAAGSIGMSDPKQAELQSRILNILNSNKGNSNAPAPSPVPAPAPVPPSTWAIAPTNNSSSATSASGVSPSPLLNDPTVQKALDSLLQGNLLKNIGEPQPAPAPAPLFAAFPYIGRLQ